jgi:hypothetical protein
MPWGEIIIASAALLAAGFGSLILLRLRAKPMEDPDDMERVRLKGSGRRKTP